MSDPHVSIHVECAAPLGPWRPIWNWFGHDEPNYTTMPHGRKLLRELAAWPKPGLVSHVDNGSHTDMDAAILQASAEALRPFFAARRRSTSRRKFRLVIVRFRKEAYLHLALSRLSFIPAHQGDC